ncbi:MAG: DUF934 domain-containing protein [Gammaproteobacteria bacterium]|nr:DUF934 domain-containing protein [Gammaproteobacteria bacterium]
MAIVTSSCEVIEDDWIRYDRQRLIGCASQVVASVADLVMYRKFFQRAVFQLGVELEVTVAIEEIQEWLPRLDLVILNFDNFADGRAFSQARLLRERYRYQGDIRAQGDVLRDQLSFMQRCGINQFDLGDSENVDLALNSFSDISKNYQPELKQVCAG